jgi:hypothetical protein
VAGAAVFLVLLGSVGLSRMSGLRTTPMLQSDSPSAATAQQSQDDQVDEGLAAGVGSSDVAPAQMLAQARLDYMGERADLDTSDDTVASDGEQDRVEIQTADPKVRIIWFSPHDNSAPVED